MKKILCILIILTMLTACGRTKTRDEEPTEAVSAEETNESSEEPEPKPSSEEESHESEEESTVQSTGNTVTLENFDRSITISTNPERVLVLTQGVTDIITSLGKEQTILPAETTWRPTEEEVLALSPDLVIAEASIFDISSFGTRLTYEQKGIGVYLMENSNPGGTTVEDTYTDIRNLGQIFSNENGAEQMVSDMQNRIHAVQNRLARRVPVKTMVLQRWEGDAYTVACGASLIDDLLLQAGGRNVFHEDEGKTKTVGADEIASRKPEVILVVDTDGNASSTIDALYQNEELARVRAVQNSCIYSVSDTLLRPGMQEASSIETLASLLNPEVFEESAS